MLNNEVRVLRQYLITRAKEEQSLSSQICKFSRSVSQLTLQRLTTQKSLYTKLGYFSKGGIWTLLPTETHILYL